MGLLVRYQYQGGPIPNGLLHYTGNPPPSVYCDHFLDNPGTLSFSVGVFTTPSLDINFSD